MRNRDTLAGGEWGLTKREAAAMAALQGELANQHTASNAHRMGAATTNGNGFDILARRAVNYADALFNELDKDGDDA